MRSLVISALVLGLCLLTTGRAKAEDDAKAIIEKAVKATGGADKIAKFHDKAAQSKSKGTIELMGGLAYTEETTTQANRFKSVMSVEISGMAITQTTVYDGKKAWVNVLNKTMELDGKALDEMKEAAHLMRLSAFTLLKDKEITLSTLGELKVNDRPAVGVKVASKGHRDVNLWFDKETGLLAKIERQIVDPMTEKEFTEERVITEYQEVEGVKIPKKAVVNRDGKKFVEVEIVEVKVVDKLDDSEFAKP